MVDLRQTFPEFPTSTFLEPVEDWCGRLLSTVRLPTSNLTTKLSGIIL
uniref:Maf-like protein DDB_G0281937 isoform X1 n=1 Tax=Rhizophora mucronata TaxID=61149 RepID=A0A2P2KVJ0_RHIMU